MGVGEGVEELAKSIFPGRVEIIDQIISIQLGGESQKDIVPVQENKEGEIEKKLYTWKLIQVSNSWFEVLDK